jgi:hypothetical protein
VPSSQTCSPEDESGKNIPLMQSAEVSTFSDNARAHANMLTRRLAKPKAAVLISVDRRPKRADKPAQPAC